MKNIIHIIPNMITQVVEVSLEDYNGPYYAVYQGDLLPIVYEENNGTHWDIGFGDEIEADETVSLYKFVKKSDLFLNLDLKVLAQYLQCYAYYTKKTLYKPIEEIATGDQILFNLVNKLYRSIDSVLIYQLSESLSEILTEEIVQNTLHNKIPLDRRVETNPEGTCLVIIPDSVENIKIKNTMMFNSFKRLPFVNVFVTTGLKYTTKDIHPIYLSNLGQGTETGKVDEVIIETEGERKYFKGKLPIIGIEYGEEPVSVSVYLESPKYDTFVEQLRLVPTYFIGAGFDDSLTRVVDPEVHLIKGKNYKKVTFTTTMQVIDLQYAIQPYGWVLEQ